MLIHRTDKQNYTTKKTDVYHLDDAWSLDILDLKDNGPEKKDIDKFLL